MKKPRPLQVRQVRRYATPRYPSHTDPDPTRLPAPVPFPFGKKLLAAAASLGLVAGARGVGAEDPAPAAPKANPFTLEHSGLPYETSSFGTGQPGRLSEEQARGVIERIFRDAGYALTKDVRIARGDVSFTADGYDAEKKVGFVWVAGARADSDMIVSWRKPEVETPATDPARLSLKEAAELEARAVKEREFIALISPYDRRFEYERWSEDLAKELQEARQISDPAKRAIAEREIHEKAVRVALTNLERCVREYIEWARSQGAQ